MITVNGHIIIPTIFPDKTQQVWNLPDEVLKASQIVWKYEGDHEIMTLGQLAALMNFPVVLCTFCPYARQDKPISNNASFGLEIFIALISVMPISRFICVDVHSDRMLELCKGYLVNAMNVFPNHEISTAISNSGATIVCFPDKGAMNRYSSQFPCSTLPSIYCDKNRDQATGEILGLSLKSDLTLDGKSVIIIDDICDGGRTFIEVAKVLLAEKVAQVSLYITHGIFSKGTQVLFDSGISKIYTLEGEIKCTSVV